LGVLRRTAGPFHEKRKLRSPFGDKTALNKFQGNVFPRRRISEETYFRGDVFPRRRISEETYFRGDV
jgi:hypothetical protein